MNRGMLLASMFGLAIAGYAFAQDHPACAKKRPANAKVVEATVAGENVCLGCTLQHQEGAAAQCGKYGHRHALKVTSASAYGEARPDLEGWVLHYLDVDNAQSVVKEHHGETVTLKGKVYTEERVLEVTRVVGAVKPAAAAQTEHPRK